MGGSDEANGCYDFKCDECGEMIDGDSSEQITHDGDSFCEQCFCGDSLENPEDGTVLHLMRAERTDLPALSDGVQTAIWATEKLAESLGDEVQRNVAKSVVEYLRQLKLQAAAVGYRFKA